MLTLRPSCLHSSRLALRTPDTCQTEGNFCMELAFFFLCGCLKKKRKKKKKEYLKRSFSRQVANSSAPKRKETGRNTKNELLLLEKRRKKKHEPCFRPCNLDPSFPNCSAMRFLKSPYLALHMLLPGADGTKLSNASPFRDKRMCEHKAKPTPALTRPVGDSRRGWWLSTPRISRMNDSHQRYAHGSTPSFPRRHQYLMND